MENDDDDRLAKVRESIDKLRSYSDCRQKPRPGIIERAIEELRLALGELQVIEEELRFQHDELLMARRDAEDRRRRYKQLFDFIPEGCLVTDVSGKIREANAAACDLLKVARDSLPGRRIDEFVAEDQLAEFRELLARLSQVRRMSGCKVRIRPAGEGPTFEAEIDAEAVLDVEDEVAAAQWIIRASAAD